jgi:hypothetical protein
MINNILKKIEKANEVDVQLERHEVELATAKDLNALYGKATSFANNLLGGVPSKIDLLKKELITLEKEAVKLISDLDGSLIDYEKITKELGLQATQNKTYVAAKKELDALYKGTSNITKIIQVLK